jgi:hypothetical protein
MTTKFHEGWELNRSTSGMIADYENVTAGGTATFVSGRLQGTALRIAGTGTAVIWRTPPIISDKTSYIGFALKVNDPTSAGFDLIKWLDSTNAVHSTLRCIRGVNPLGYKLQLCRGGGASPPIISTSAEYAPDSWFYHEVLLTMNTVGVAVFDGAYTLKTNEIVDTTLTSSQTSALAPGVTLVAKFEYSMLCLGSNGSYIDDMYFADSAGGQTFLGDQVVEALLPASDDTTIQWSIFPSSPTTHFSKVDDGSATHTVSNAAHDSDATYIFSTADGQTDYFNMSDLLFLAGTINGVMVRVAARLSTSGSRTFKVRYKDVTPTEVSGSNIVITQTAYAPTFYQYWAQDPITVAAWTTARLNAARFGLLTG